MKKKLSRLLRPGLIACFVVMLCFCVAAVVLKQYYLAAGETALTALLFTLYLLDRKRRSREIQTFIQNASAAPDITGKTAEPPLPMALVRLGDNGIVWASDRFAAVTGYRQQVPEQNVADVLPGISMDWLAAGNTEYPYDVTIDARRYRVYGTSIRANDVVGTYFGVLYLSDLTEMYHFCS